MKNDRYHPTERELQLMTDEELIEYAEQEEEFLDDQHQTAVPRLLHELVRRIRG